MANHLSARAGEGVTRGGRGRWKARDNRGEKSKGKKTNKHEWKCVGGVWQ